MIDVPAGLGWWRERPGGEAWLARLPAIVAELASRWSLELEAPLEPALISLVIPATLPDGSRAVLKINFPEPESEHEADALGAWNGDGAARLLEAAPEVRALLVERLDPGTPLWELPDEDEANQIGADVLRRLHRATPPSGVRPLGEEAERWATELPDRWRRLGKPFPQRLLDEATTSALELSGTQADVVLLHQDLHGGNVLRDGDGWRAIDPKPLAGDPAFDTASLLRDRRADLLAGPRPEERVVRRLDQLSENLGLDRERMRGWALVHALAWGLEETRVHRDMLACAELLADRP